MASTRTSFLIFLLLVVGSQATAQFPNVLIGNQDAPEEVSICINPKNLNQLVAGANISHAYSSSDGGLNWNSDSISSPAYGVWGDPCIISDTSGNFYFFHLSFPPPGKGNWVDRIVCQKSTDGGMTYDKGGFVGLNGKKVQDKPWPVYNPVKNEIYVTWTQFDVYESHNPKDSSIIRFSKSADQGKTWTKPVRISRQAGDCLDSDSTVEGAVPCVGPDGEIYVAWAGPEGLVFNKSLDDGETWMPREKVICKIPGGWDYPVPGLQRCNGLPITACDLSDGPGRGTIYINWSDQRKGKGDADVWLVKSTDKGETWSAPIRVNNDPPGTQQFMSWMALDQERGDVYVVYYDRRNDQGNGLTDVYLARSRDGGLTFMNERINALSFIPDSAVFFGDYINLSVSGGEVRPIWMACDGYNLSVWTAIINSRMLDARENKVQGYLPWNLEDFGGGSQSQPATIKFVLPERGPVQLTVYDVLGRRVVSLYKGQVLPRGGHSYQFDASAAGLQPGLYYYYLESGSLKQRNKIYVH